MNKRVLKEIVNDYAEHTEECAECVCGKFEKGACTCPVAEYDGYEWYGQSEEACADQIYKAVLKDGKK